MSRLPTGAEAVTATPASGDFLLFVDISDSNKIKKATTTNVLDAAGTQATQTVTTITTTTLTPISTTITVSDGAYDFDIASHDTTNGLKLGGTLVSATAAELNILDGVTATAAEINNACDVSGRLITIADGTNTLALDAPTHANRVLKVMDATLAITLPEATGTGNSYTILQGIAATSSTIVTADTANCGFHGFIMGSDTDAAGTYSWIATGTQDTITLNGVATGGKLYDWIRVTDVATDAWLLEGNIKQSGGSEATPLSSAA